MTNYKKIALKKLLSGHKQALFSLQRKKQSYLKNNDFDAYACLLDRQIKGKNNIIDVLIKM